MFEQGNIDVMFSAAGSKSTDRKDALDIYHEDRFPFVARWASALLTDMNAHG